MRWVPSSPRGERRKRTPLPNAIALARGEGEGSGRPSESPPPLRGRVRVGGAAAARTVAPNLSHRPPPPLRGGDRGGVRREGGLRRPRAAEPAGHPAEAKIDHPRRVERQELPDHQASQNRER